MYKHQFVKEVAALSELTDGQVRNTLTAIKKVVTHELVNTGEVNIPGLVHLKVLPRKERLGRNLSNGERQIVASGHTLKSRPTGKLVSDVLSDLHKDS